MGIRQYEIPGFNPTEFIQQLQGAIAPYLTPYCQCSLAQRTVLCTILSSLADSMLGVEPEDRMQIIQEFNKVMDTKQTRAFIRQAHPYGVREAFCLACGQALPKIAS